MVGKDGFRLMRHNQGFTLIEISTAILVLVVGMVSALTLIMTGLDWGKDVRYQTVAIETVRAALYDADIIEDGQPHTAAEVKGYVNGFYVVRRSGAGTDEIGGPINSDLSGDFTDVELEVYAGVLPGNDETSGTLVWKVSSKIYHPE